MMAMPNAMVMRHRIVAVGRHVVAVISDEAGDRAGAIELLARMRKRAHAQCGEQADQEHEEGIPARPQT